MFSAFWFSPDQVLLDERFPLPLDEAFTPADGVALGVSPWQLRCLVDAGHLRRVVPGVYAAAQAPDDVHFRARALGLVIPQSAIVTDRTAAWLHGVSIMPRSAVTAMPPISIFQSDGTRLRRPGVSSGLRGLAASDISEVEGIRVTSPLRTALDLGRLLWRFDALAAIDGFLRIGVPHELLLAEIARFKGYRGVVQLRALAPLGAPLSESPAESALRLHWYDAGLPRPTLQHWVSDEQGVARYRLDLSLPEIMFAAEYDGEEFHTSVLDRSYDGQRRAWLMERGWKVVVFTKEDVYSPNGDPVTRLRSEIADARKDLHRRGTQSVTGRRTRKRSA